MSGICPCTMGNSIAGALFNLKNAKDLNKHAPEQSGVGTVLSRRVDTVYSLTRSDSSWMYFVKFHLENAEDLELKTTEENYKAFTEGSVFGITWQGDTLVSFDRE